MAITFVVAFIVILFEPFQGPFKDSLVRGLSVVIAAAVPCMMAMRHWLGARKARKRRHPGPAQHHSDETRDRLIGAFVLAIAILSVIARFAWYGAR